MSPALLLILVAVICLGLLMFRNGRTVKAKRIVGSVNLGNAGRDIRQTSTITGQPGSEPATGWLDWTNLALGVIGAAAGVYGVYLALAAEQAH